MINSVDYAEVLRKSTKVQLQEKILLLQSQSEDYIKQQLANLKTQYQKELQQLLDQLEEYKYKYSQLKIQNDSYVQMILEYEHQSVKNRNYISLEIVNQLLCEKMKALLILLKNNNIISEEELQNQLLANSTLIKAGLQGTISQQNNPLNQQFQFEVINATNSKNFNNTSQQNSGEKKDNEQNKKSRGIQVKIINRKEKMRNSVQIPLSKKQINLPQRSDFSKELEEFKKSIKALEKSRRDLQNSNEMLKSQNKDLQSRINLKQLTETPKSCPPKVIMKFLKFDDIVYKQMTQFQTALSFDLRQGVSSTRNFSTGRPKSSVSCSNRYRMTSYQQPTFQMYM